MVEGVPRARGDSAQPSGLNGEPGAAPMREPGSLIPSARRSKCHLGLGGHVRRVVVVRPLPTGPRDTDPRLAPAPAASHGIGRRSPRRVQTAGARRIARGTRGAGGRARAGRGHVAPAHADTRARGVVHRTDHAAWLSSLRGGPVASSGPVERASRGVVAGGACVSALLTSALLPTGAAEAVAFQRGRRIIFRQ